MEFEKKSFVKAWITLYLSILIGCGKSGAITVSNNRVSFIREPRDSIVVEGQRVELECMVTDKNKTRLITRWLKNADLSTHFKHAPNGSLIFPTVDHSHEGSYQCVALNVLPFPGVLLSRSARISIAKISPISNNVTISSRNSQDMYAAVGSVVRLECKIFALPSSTSLVKYEWYHNDLPLATDDRFYILDSGVLQLTNVISSDYGNYTCSGSNVAGKVFSDRIHLISLLTGETSSASVEFSAEFLAIPKNTSTELGADAFFECLLNDSRANNAISWKRLGNTAMPTSASRIGTNLRITNAELWHEGWYQCESSIFNDKKLLAAKAYLSIDHPPVIYEFPKEEIKKRGEIVRFSCNTVANPVPQITWYKNGEPIKSHGRIKLFPSNNMPPDYLTSSAGEKQYKRDLLISSIRLEDGGFYQCFAKNRLGEASAAALLVYKDDGEREAPANLTAVTLQSDEKIRLRWKISQSLLDQKIAVFILHFHSNAVGDVENTEPISFKDACRTGTDCSTLCCGLSAPLKSCTNYTFWISALLKSGTFTMPSNEVTVTTWEEATTRPVPLTLRELPDSAVHLEWDALPLDVQRGVVHEYRVEGANASQLLWRRILPPKYKDYTFQNLLRNKEYKFRVIPKTAAGYPSDSKTKHFPWTTFKTRSYPLPVNASNLTGMMIGPTLNALPLNSTAVLIEWKIAGSNSSTTTGNLHNFQPPPLSGIVSNTMDQWQIELSKVHGSNDIVARFRLALTEHVKIVNGLTTDTLYRIAIARLYQNLTGLTSIRNVRTLLDETISTVNPLIPFPTGISCTVENQDSLKLTWTQPSSFPATKFLVRLSPAPEGDELLNASLVQIKETTVNFIIVSGLTASRSYLFAVKAETSTSSSKFSDDIKCALPKPVPNQPSIVQHVKIGNSSIFLSWISPDSSTGSAKIKFYRVRYKIYMTSDNNWLELLVNGSTQFAYLSNLSSSETYFITIFAENDAGMSLPSVPIIVPLTSPSSDYSKNTSTIMIPKTSYAEGVIVGCCVALVCICIFLTIKTRRSGSNRACFYILRTFRPAGSNNTNNSLPRKPNNHNDKTVQNRTHCFQGRHCTTALLRGVEKVEMIQPLVQQNSLSDSKGYSDSGRLPILFESSEPLHHSLINGFNHRSDHHSQPEKFLTVTIESPNGGCGGGDIVETTADGLIHQRDHHHRQQNCCDPSQNPLSHYSLSGTMTRSSAEHSWSNNGGGGCRHSSSSDCTNRRSYHHCSSSMPNLTDSGIGFDEYSNHSRPDSALHSIQPITATSWNATDTKNALPHDDTLSRSNNHTRNAAVINYPNGYYAPQQLHLLGGGKSGHSTTGGKKQQNCTVSAHINGGHHHSACNSYSAPRPNSLHHLPFQDKAAS